MTLDHHTEKNKIGTVKMLKTGMLEIINIVVLTMEQFVLTM